MNVYDAAHNLSRAIKNSTEYKEYLEKHRKVYSNPVTKEMVEDYRKKTIDMQLIYMKGQKVEDEKINQIKKIEEVLMSNPIIKEFFMAEMKFGQMMNDIYKIIGKSIEIDIDI